MRTNLSITSLFVSNQLGGASLLSVKTHEAFSLQKSRFNRFSVPVVMSKSLRPQFFSKNEFTHFTTTALTLESVRTEQGHDMTHFFEAFSCAALTIIECKFHDITNTGMNGACCFTYKQDMSYCKVVSNTFTNLKNSEYNQDGAFSILYGNDVTIEKNCFEKCSAQVNDYSAFSVSTIKTSMKVENNLISECGGEYKGNIFGVKESEKAGFTAAVEFSKNNITKCDIDSTGVIHIKKDCTLKVSNSNFEKSSNPGYAIFKDEGGSTVSLQNTCFIRITDPCFYLAGASTFDSVILIDTNDLGVIKNAQYSKCFSNIDGLANFQFDKDLKAPELGINAYCKQGSNPGGNPGGNPDEKPGENPGENPGDKPGSGGNGENNNQDGGSEGQPLNGGEIAGIVIGVIVAVAAIAAVTFFLVKRKKGVPVKAEADSPSSQSEN